MPIDYSETFVPGLKRGYAIIPIIHKRGETEDQRREDVQNTLQKVRRANVMLGMTAGGATPQGVDVPLPVSGEATQSPPGGESQAGGAGDGGHGTCPVWYRNERISSGTLDCRKGGEGRCWLFALMSCGQTPGKERRGSEGGVAAAAR